MTFEKLRASINTLENHYGITSEVIGESLLGEPIKAFHTGNTRGKQIIITGAIHAREWITALLVTELAKIYAHNIRGIWFIPLCNPDGVKIALSGSPLWKANTRGVDLNVNFDADWGHGDKNITVAGAENFIGEKPESEPETKALSEFTKRIKPKAVAAFHSKGEVVYYRYNSSARLAKRVARSTGYKAIKTRGSVGGYCDFAADLGIQAVTIEVGNDKLAHPIDEKEIVKIIKQNIDVPTLLL